jgi:hypothetical protein
MNYTKEEWTARQKESKKYIKLTTAFREYLQTMDRASDVLNEYYLAKYSIDLEVEDYDYLEETSQHEFLLIQNSLIKTMEALLSSEE